MQACRGSVAGYRDVHLRDIFWILSPLSWVSESFRQDIGRFLSPRMKTCKLADCFIKVIFHVVGTRW